MVSSCPISIASDETVVAKVGVVHQSVFVSLMESSARNCHNAIEIYKEGLKCRRAIVCNKVLKNIALSLLVGFPKVRLSNFQSVLNDVAKLIARHSRTSHTS